MNIKFIDRQTVRAENCRTKKYPEAKSAVLFNYYNISNILKSFYVCKFLKIVKAGKLSRVKGICRTTCSHSAKLVFIETFCPVKKQENVQKCFLKSAFCIKTQYFLFFCGDLVC